MSVREGNPRVSYVELIRRCLFGCPSGGEQIRYVGDACVTYIC